MKIFVRVAELASFTQAAAQLGLPKATVSEAVKGLEDRLGTRLLQRTTRRVQLTQDGALCHQRCREMLAELDELEGLFRRESSELEGRLRVDMPLGVAEHIVMPRLPEFLARHPRLAVDVCSSDRRVDLIREGFDCVLRIGELEDSSLVARPLGRVEQVNLASPGYLVRHGTPRTLADLEHHFLVHYAASPGSPVPGFEYFDGRQSRFIPMAGQVAVNNSVAYRGACLAGLGLVQVPRMGSVEQIEAGRLVEVLPDWRPRPMPVSLLLPDRRHLPRRVRAFMAWLEEAVAPFLDPPEDAKDPGENPVFAAPGPDGSH